MLSRRRFLELAGVSPLVLTACARGLRLKPSPRTAPGPRVNDVHSQLNATTVARIVRPDSLEAVTRALRAVRSAGRSGAVAGARHSMGGQQFLTGGVLLDTLGMNRVLGFDRERGLITKEAGIQWPQLFTYLESTWAVDGAGWGIVQKQTGADWLALGGALSANVHGRGLTLPPIVHDVESFVLVDDEGIPRTVSRAENPELFRLAIGGYGLFGVIAQLTLRLAPRRKVQRVVLETVLEDVIPVLRESIVDGHLYGDFQFGIDSASETDFLRRGVLATYRPVPGDTPIPRGQRGLSDEDWKQLLVLAHTDRSSALRVYLEHYLATSGQIYWADTQQLGFYLPDYHRALDAGLAGQDPGTEIIGEVYVPREGLVEFMAGARSALREHQVVVIYGTVRLIEEDTETFLRWAKAPYACIVFNLHPQRGWDRAFRRRVPRLDRLRGRARRVLLPHLPPLRYAGPGRGGVSAVRGVPAPEAGLRSRRALPERLVPPLP